MTPEEFGLLIERISALDKTISLRFDYIEKRQSEIYDNVADLGRRMGVLERCNSAIEKVIDGLKVMLVDSSDDRKSIWKHIRALEKSDIANNALKNWLINNWKPLMIVILVIISIIFGIEKVLPFLPIMGN